MADLLFNDADLRGILAEVSSNLVAEVNAAPSEHLLKVDQDAWAVALAEKWAMHAPTLQADAMWQEEAQEVQVDVRGWGNRFIRDASRPAWFPGYRVVVHIPFDGDPFVFKLRASTRSFNPPSALIRRGEVIQIIEYPNDAPADIRAQAEQLVGKLETHLGWARGDVESFNRGLEDEAKRAIGARYARLRSHEEHIAKTGLPVGPPGQRKKTYVADAIVRRPAPVLPASPTNKPLPLEPALADAVYDHVLSIIRNAGREMERAPRTYKGMGEEDRRQVLMLPLNNAYDSRATAEAFNHRGKTDILLKFETANLFIAECKIWSGPKAFSETIDQLFRYTGWRDTKLAIIMFVKEKGLTDIVNKARAALEAHPSFVTWQQVSAETEFRATVSWPGDADRHADLTVLFFSTPDT